MFVSTQLIHINISAIYNRIYPLVAFENGNLSFEEFKMVLNGEVCENISEDEIRLVQNMEAACMYMLDTLNEVVSVDYAYRINEILTRGRITGEQKRDYEITAKDLEYIRILQDCHQDLSSYNLNKIVPEIPDKNSLDHYMNVSEETYQSIINEVATTKYEGFAYRCFMPMIRTQYFKEV